METAKICPFRTHELIQGRCVTECQLFVSGKQTCALAEVNQNLIQLLIHMGNIGNLISATNK